MRSWLSMRPARVREGAVSTDRERRHRPSLPGSFQAHHSVIRPKSSCGSAIFFRRLRDLRSWPLVGFEAIRIYYPLEEDAIHIIRILHGKPDVKRILQSA